MRNRNKEGRVQSVFFKKIIIFLTLTLFNGLFWFSFDKIRHFFINIFNFGGVTKKLFLALSDASKCVFENLVLDILLSNLNNHLFFKVRAKNVFFSLIF
jgi:hypothetical protein